MSERSSSAAASAETEPGQPIEPIVTTVSAHFKMIFISVVVITVGTLAADLCIAIFVSNPSAAAKSAMSTCSTIANLGFGAMVGLLGGKAV